MEIRLKSLRGWATFRAAKLICFSSVCTCTYRGVFVCISVKRLFFSSVSGKRHKRRLASSLQSLLDGEFLQSCEMQNRARWIRIRRRRCLRFVLTSESIPPLIVLIFGKVVWVHQRERHYFEFGARIEFEWISRLSTVGENSCCGVGYCVIERPIWPRYIHIHIRAETAKKL